MSVISFLNVSQPSFKKLDIFRTVELFLVSQTSVGRSWERVTLLLGTFRLTNSLDLRNKAQGEGGGGVKDNRFTRHEISPYKQYKITN